MKRFENQTFIVACFHLKKKNAFFLRDLLSTFLLPFFFFNSSVSEFLCDGGSQCRTSLGTSSRALVSAAVSSPPHFGFVSNPAFSMLSSGAATELWPQSCLTEQCFAFREGGNEFVACFLFE